jgi:Ca-activated chloride channel family protein
MSFKSPLLLLILLAIPLVLLAVLWLERRRARFPVRFTNLEVLAAVAAQERNWLRRAPLALLLLALTAAALAAARPEIEMTVTDENATVVLVIDTSGSMVAQDVRPNRLEAAKRAALRFIESAPKQLRIALIGFASEPQVLAPPTHDRDLVRESMDYLFPGAGTAIGDALQAAVELVEEPQPEGPSQTIAVGRGLEDKPPAAIVFLSDGAQRRGFLQPLEGAALAKEAGIPVYTVALGTPEGVIDAGQFGAPGQVIPVPPDPETLRAIAEETGGEFFEAKNAPTLEEVYEGLGSRLGKKRERREVTSIVAGVAALLALLGAGLARLGPAPLP